MSRFPAVALTSAVLLAGVRLASAAPSVVFDDISNVQNGVTGASVTATGSTPNTFMGDGYTLAAGTTDITGFDLGIYNNSGTNYTGIRATVYVWGTVNTGTVSATAPAFSNLLATYTQTLTGAYSTGILYYDQSATPGVTPGLSLASPLAISATNIGVTVAFQGTTDGINFSSANSLTSAITYGSTPSVGVEDFNGYYRNANSETNGNFTSVLRSLGLSNQSVGLRVYGDISAAAGAPEPASLALIGLGLAGMIARRRRALPVD